MNQEKIGKFIAELRKEKNLTQAELAEKLNITKNAVSKWERGLSLMDISLLKPLSEILGVSVSELLNGERIEKIDNDIINDTITASTKIYVKKEKHKFIKRILIIISVVFVLVFSSLVIISELNYGIIPLGEKMYVDFPNISSLNVKKKADECMELILNRNIEKLDKLVVSNQNFLLFESSSPNAMIEEELKELSGEVHSKAYIDNLNYFYEKVVVKDYKYNFFYYNGSGYVFDYDLEVIYDDKTYVLNIQILPHKEVVEFSGFGFKNTNVEIYSDLYNLAYSVFYW